MSLGDFFVTIRVFISSPSDVTSERTAVERVAATINAKYSGQARIEPVLWEAEPLQASKDFQSQIQDPALCDAVIGILWGRYGTRIDTDLEMPASGPSFVSGTGFEIMTALKAARETRRPDIYLLRKQIAPTAGHNAQQTAEIAAQQHELDLFWKLITVKENGTNAGAYDEFTDLPTFERHITKIFEKLIADRRPARQKLIWNDDREGSPFPGLKPFDPAQAEVYFGRERKVLRTLDELKRAQQSACAFLVIFGATGSGKSSLMRAGLAPRVRGGALGDETARWRLAIMRPADQPFRQLAEALLYQPLQGESDSRGFGAALPDLADSGYATPILLGARLERIGAELLELMHRVRAQEASFIDILPGTTEALELTSLRILLRRTLAEVGEGNGNGRLLLMIDQFEDLFSTEVTDQARDRFAALLAGLATTPNVLLVATLRDDLYHRILGNPVLMALKDRGRYFDLSPPGPSEIGEIISRSTQACGLDFETDPNTGESLGTRLEDAAGEQRALPLLQFVLSELYEKRLKQADGRGLLTFAAYKQLGGLEGAVNSVANQAFETLPVDRQKALMKSLPALVRMLSASVTTGADTALIQEAGVLFRPVRYSEMRRNSDLLELVNILIEKRILTVSDESRDGSDRAVVAVSHERVFYAWEQANKVLKENIDLVRTRNLIANFYDDWKRDGRPQNRWLLSGPHLSRAQGLMKAAPEEVPDDVRNYIDLSKKVATARERWNRRIRVAVGSALTTLTVLAGVFAYDSRKQATLAIANYKEARDGAERIAGAFTEGLADQQGLRADLVERALGVAERSLNGLVETNKSDPDLVRIQGGLYVGFSKLFRKAGDNKKAAEAAQRAIAALEPLVAAVPPNMRLLKLLSTAHDLHGDTYRFSVQRNTDKETKKTLLDQAQASYAQGRKSIDRMFDLGDADLAKGEDLDRRLMRSRNLTRIGDITGTDSERWLLYQQARETMEATAKLYPGNPEVQRELAWVLQKRAQAYAEQGDRALTAGNGPQARIALLQGVALRERVVCLRSDAFKTNPGSLLAEKDFAFALDFLAIERARPILQQQPMAILTPQFLAIDHFETLMNDDPLNPDNVLQLVKRQLRAMDMIKAFLDQGALLPAEAAGSIYVLGRRTLTQLDSLRSDLKLQTDINDLIQVTRRKLGLKPDTTELPKLVRENVVALDNMRNAIRTGQEAYVKCPPSDAP